MNNEKTIDRMKNNLPEGSKGREKFDEALDSGDNTRVRLIPKGEKLYRTGSRDSGGYFSKEHPGKTPAERRENLQLYPKNDGEQLSRMTAKRPKVGIQSDIRPQSEWAKEAGYKARPGMKQIYVPSANENGALAERNRFASPDKNISDKRGQIQKS